MDMVAHAYYTADMVRALPNDGNRYETVYGELLVTPAPRLLHQLVLQRLLRLVEDFTDHYGIGTTFISPAELGDYQQRAQNGRYDLIIYDDCLPPVTDEDAAAADGVQLPALMPQANTLLIGRLPPGGAWSAKAKVNGPQIIDIVMTLNLNAFSLTKK